MTATAWLAQDRIYIKATYADRLTCKGLPGARWNAGEKAWHIPATPHAADAMYEAFRQHEVDFDEGVLTLLRQAADGRRAQASKTATDLPDFPGRTEGWNHQRQAFHFAKDMPASTLQMDMGTGKSKVAIGLLEEWNAMRVLILCPKSVLAVWPLQFRSHAEREWAVVAPSTKVTVVNRAAQIALATEPGRPHPLVCLINYEAAWRPAMATILRTIKWDAIILDESHRIKAPGGKASMFVSKLRDSAERRLCLTGTPMPHSPLDIYAQYRFLDQGVFGTSAHRFKQRYAIMGGFENRQIVDWQNQDEMAKKIGLLAFVCKKDEVLDLPEYHHITRTCELEPKAVKAYKSMEELFVTQLEDGQITAANALARLLRLQQITSGYLPTPDEDNPRVERVSEAKEKLLSDVMEDFDPHEPLIVFARFQHDLDTIERVATEQGRSYGELSGRRRDGLTEDAQMAEFDVVGVQIQAGGVGIDLTRARYAIYFSLGFSLGDFEQSLARLHRPGQKHQVTYMHLLAEGTVDEKVYRALAQRRQVVEAVIEASRKEESIAAG